LYSVSARAGLTAAAALAAVLVAAGCSSSSSSSSSSAPAAAGSSSAPAASASASGSAPALSVSDFNNSFSAMAQLKPLASSGKGSIAVILPDTVTSPRYVQFDAPYLTQAFKSAGLTEGTDFTVQNAQGSDSTQLSDAQTAITKGASVLIVDPLDSGVGAQIESLAKQNGVQVIDYDRLTLGGTRSYYVSFDNVKVGALMGSGLQSCITAWGVKTPQVIFMKGDPTDNNATLFAQGSSSVLDPLFKAKTYTEAATPPGTWTPATALTEFQQAFTKDKNINAALIPNDANAGPIIHYLQNQGVKAKTFPTTGQDASLVGLQNILTGYQCGTVYKPIYLEAQGAAALAMYLRAGQTPPSSLANGTTQDTKSNTAVPSVLLTPEWVTVSNLGSTVVADKSVPAAQLCAGSYAAACKAAGISG
jgi:D-xylose transport system substrate-binding protein